MHISAELERQIKALPGLPSPPTVAHRLIELAKLPDFEAKELVNVISMDSALSAKVLRIANSPLYAKFRKTETLRQALTVLGLNAALSICLSFSLAKALRGTQKSAVDPTLYWQRSVLAALSARSIGEELKSPLVEELFMAGLLQDIGILALSKIAPDFYSAEALANVEHEGLVKRERGHFGSDHAEVGAWLLNSWNMPERTVQAVLQSHAIERSEFGSSATDFNASVALSGHLSDLFLSKNKAAACANGYLRSKTLLNFDESRLDAVLSRINAVMADTEALFDMKLVKNPEEIVAQARELLMFRQLPAAS
jgi:HD-like signal output (HDOD) protein